MADINGKIRLLRGTLASFAAGAFTRCIRIITDSANGETLATWNGTEWIQMARQLADGSLKSQGLKVNGSECIDASRNAQFASVNNEAITPGVFPVQGAGGEEDSSLSEDADSVNSAKPVEVNGNVTSSGSFQANSAAGVPARLRFQTAGVNRWSFYKDSSAESGSNSGSAIAITAWSDAGAVIDNPVVIQRPAGGQIQLNRPVKISEGLGSFGVTPPASRPTISGQRTATATLAALYDAIGDCGLIIDATTGTSVTREAIIQPLPITNSAPGTVTVVSGGMKSFGFDGNTVTEELFYHCDVQHDYIADGDMIFHVHWMPATATGGDVKFQIEYQWVEAGATWPAPSTLTGTTAAGTTAWADKRTDFTIPGAGHTYNSRIMIRLFRNPTDAADTYTGDAVLSSVGMHYQADPGQP